MDYEDEFDVDGYADADEAEDLNDLSNLTYTEKAILKNVLLESMSVMSKFRAESKKADTQLRESLYELNVALDKAGVDVKGDITDWDREYLAIVTQKEKKKYAN